MENIVSLVNNVPMSVLPHPSGTWARAKHVFWRVITPSFLSIRDTLLKYDIIYHKGRQEYRLGALASLEKLEPFLVHLQTHGFGNHFVAWKDDDQLISLRRPDGFEYQYHLRIFNDGEIRGHYEFTPEAHPLWHFHEVGHEERRDEFLRFLGDWVA